MWVFQSNSLCCRNLLHLLLFWSQALPRWFVPLFDERPCSYQKQWQPKPNKTRTNTKGQPTTSNQSLKTTTSTNILRWPRQLLEPLFPLLLLPQLTSFWIGDMSKLTHPRRPKSQTRNIANDEKSPFIASSKNRWANGKASEFAIQLLQVQPQQPQQQKRKQEQYHFGLKQIVSTWFQ